MEEYIGKVRLCYEKEPECGMTETEEEMYKIAQDVPEENYNAFLFSVKKGEIIHHFVQERSNIISWLPFSKQDTVLELGASYGTITSALAAEGANVDGVEPDYYAAKINAVRNRDKDGITLICGELWQTLKTSGKKYSHILVIGTFEQLLKEGGISAAEGLKELNRHLVEGGRIILAVSNKYGLKYWAGQRDECTGEFFAGLTGDKEKKGYAVFSYDSLKKALTEAGFSRYEFYYPYPDHEFTELVYSDQYLPEPGTLPKSDNNFILDRMELFDETRVFDTLIADHKFVEFSNSYLLLIEGEQNG